MRYRPPHQLGVQITATAALITQRASVLVFFFSLSFFLFCRHYDEAPGHTKVGTEVIVVKSLNVFAGDSTVHYFYDSRKRRTKRIGPGFNLWDRDPNDQRYLDV